MPESSLPFHAHHYGFFGISFKKNKLIEDTNFDRTVIGTHTLSPVMYLDPYFCDYQELLIEKMINNSSDILVLRSSLEQLLLIKPIDDESLLPENYYSVYFEREWRYISSSQVFKFSIDSIESIFLPHEEYDEANILHPEKFIARPSLKKIIEFATNNEIKVKTIKNELRGLKRGMPRYEDYE